MVKANKKKKKLQFIDELKHRPLTLRLYPDSILREKALPVQSFNTVLQDFANEMLFFMEQHEGIGLAAPQVGILRRIVVADIGEGPICLVNPQIVAGSGTEDMNEGCLSLPGYTVDINRKKSIKIRSKTLKGKRIDFELDGLMARVIQHEVDHLNGTLICDYSDLLPEIEEFQQLDQENELDG
ncbi:MAG: peptide deformylase [Deltaproteobacteria bacterium]|nr:peptide deformylase [Deltaproteobacteria bacterium]